MSTFRIASLGRAGRRASLETLESRLVFSSVITSGLPGGIEAFQFTQASATPTAASAPSAAAVVAGKSALGGNLNMQSDRIQDHPFTNLVKTTRGFYNVVNRVASNGQTDFARTNTDGWPTEAFAFSVADNAEYGVPIDAGVYKMSFKGPSGVLVSTRRTAPEGAGTVPSNAPFPTLSKVSYNAATGVHTYNINVPTGALTLALEFRGTGGSVRDVVVVPPGYDLNNFPTLSNEYVNLLKDLSPNVLRLMDWTQTNNNPVVNWADRTKPTDATQTKVGAPGELVPAKGIAWEHAIQLANTLNTDVWVNVPARASDDYINNLAALLRDTLKPELNIYLEYSNEVWNTQFDQTKFNTDQAKAEVAANPNSNLKDGGTTNTTTWADRRYAREVKELGDRFKAVWAAGGKANPLNTKVRVMLGGQYANLSRFDNELAYLNKFYGTPSNYIYGIGIAPYINLGGNQSKEGLTKDQVLDSLRGSINAMRNGSGLANAKTKAEAWDLQLMAYEGGIDTFGPTSVAAKRAAVLDPAITQIVEDYLDVWYDKGGNQFNWYTLGARSFNSINGTWSISEDIRNYTQPKEIGFKNVRDLGRGNDDTPPPVGVPTVSINDVSGNEGNSGSTTLTFIVTRSGDTSGASSVNWATQNGAADAADYAAASGTVSFAAGETSKSIAVSLKSDTSVEPNETFSVNLSGAVGATITDGQGIGTILNDDSSTPPTQPAVLRVDAGAGPFTDSAGNVWAKDSGFVGGGPSTSLFAVANTTDDALYATRRGGNFTYAGDVANGSYNLRLLFTDTNTTTNSRKFNVSVEGQQVLTNFDIVANGGSKAAISKTFPVNITDGKLDMAFQSVVGNAALSAFELIPTTTNPPALPTLSINNVSAAEGNSGTTARSFTITRAGDTSGASSVQWATQNGTADAADYQSASGTISFAAGEASKTVTVNVVGDTDVEANETFSVNLSGAVGATIADGQGIGTITNDDSSTPPPTTPATLRVDAGAGPFTDSAGNVWAKDSGFVGGGPSTSLFAVANTTDDALYATRRGGNFTYSGAVANGTYNLRLLFTDTNTTVNSRKFNVSVEGQSVLTNFDIVANGGSKAAISKTFPVTISDGKLDMAFQSVVGNAALSAFELVPTTTTPPPAGELPTISISDVSKSEGDSGSSAFTFTVSRAGDTSAASSVQYATQTGTANSADYAVANGTVSFAAGETSKTVSVTVNGDTDVENNETFSVVLSGVVGATIAKGTGSGTIVNDDTDTTPPPTGSGVSLGGNLASQNEYTRDHAFADLVKATSGFKTLSGGKATVDANGWPTQDFVVPLWADSTVDVGRYNVSFNGPSNTVVTLNGGKGTLTKAGGSASVQNYTIDIPTGTSALSLKFTGTSGQVKNLKVIQPNMTSSQVWSTKFVNHLKSLHPETLRMMDITKANSNTTATWADRPEVTDANFARAGAAWEHLIDLSNQVGSNIWVNIPVRATDDYVRQLAALLKTRLNPGLKVYAEIANEVWSTAHDPGKYNTEQAKLEVANNPNSNLDYDGTTNSEKWAERRYARRSMEISNLFKEVWTTTFNGTTAQANPINNRVRVILGGQAVRLARFDNMLNYINDNYGAPKDAFYGTGLAWYFSLNKYKDVYDSTGKAVGPTGVTKEQMLEGMEASVTAYEDLDRFGIPARQAAGWGLKLLGYELGVDTFGPMNVAAKAAANLDPAISGLMQRFVNAFEAQGGDSAQWYRIGAQNYNTSSGTWGITNNLDNVNSPKAQAFRILRGFAPNV